MNRKISLIAGLLISVALAVLLNSSTVRGDHTDVLGWLWGGTTDGAASLDSATGLGWASLTTHNNDGGEACIGTNPVDCYGVKIPETGDVTGYAWLSNVGWLDFHPTSGFPTTGCGAPCPDYGVRREGNELKGWARIVSIWTASTTAQNSGGWEGWVKMSGDNYDVNVNSDGTVTGFAWSNEFGWLEFNAGIGGAPTCTLTANPLSGAAPLTTDISWITVGADSCLAFDGSSGWPGPKDSSGGTETYTISSDATYNLECYNDSGTGSCSTTVTVTSGGDTLSVVLTANPPSGTEPLNDVDLIADVSGTASGDIRYRFDCTNNGSYEIDITSSSDPYNATAACDYSTAGTYTARVRVDRESLFAEDTTTITVLPAGDDDEELSVSCSGAPDPAFLSYGGVVTWRAEVTAGGDGSYTYAWDFDNDEVGFDDAAGNPVSTTYTTSGDKVVEVFADDEAGAIDSATCKVTVKRFRIFEKIPFF